MVHLWPKLKILEFWEFLHGSSDDARPRNSFRLQLNYLDDPGKTVLARAVLIRLQPRIAGQEVLGSRDDAEWPRERRVAKRSISF